MELQAFLHEIPVERIIMRVQFDFSETALKELDALKGKLNAKSRGEVINHALGVLKWLVNEKLEKDGRIIVARKDAPSQEVIFPQLETLVSNHDQN